MTFKGQSCGGPKAKYCCYQMFLGGLACQEGQCHLEDPAVSDPSSGHEHQHLDLAEKLSLSTPEQSLP